MDEIKKDLLSITELAKLRRVTSETLRYYDRIGLIRPVYTDPDTHYRYYSIRQYEKLGTIKELRQLGMSIEDILGYFSDRNLEKSMSILHHHQALLEEELEKATLLNEIMKRKLNFLDAFASLPVKDTPFECTFPARHIITFGEPAGGPREHAYAFTRLERYLDEISPILASDRVGVYCDESILEASDGYTPAVPMIFLDNSSLKSDYKHQIPAGRYVCIYYQNGSLERYHPCFELLKTYMAENHYQVAGKIFQLYKIDVTLTSIPEETLMELQVPIQKA
ncbi:MAG: MerR family transcriptional regulator [Oscillospiraceae bacterium]